MTRVGLEVFLLPASDPLGSVPRLAVAKFEWLGCFGILEARGQVRRLILRRGTPLFRALGTPALASHKFLLNTYR